MEVLSLEPNPWTVLPNWMKHPNTKNWKNKILGSLSWEQPLVQVYGKKYLVPRKTAFLAEKGVSYSYSGIIHRGIGWPEWFRPLLNDINYACSTNFNGCLFNLYRNGSDKMGWHSDDEPELKESCSIASFSLGSTRDFFFRHKIKNIKHHLSLSEGDLLIMYPNCQRDWIHSLPARNRVLESRINLTFRCYLV